MFTRESLHNLHVVTHGNHSVSHGNHGVTHGNHGNQSLPMAIIVLSLAIIKGKC